jgi:NADH-quinone oxidoreductase subunit M
VVSAALFFCVGVIYDRLHTREIVRYGGLTENMPRYAVFFLLFTMASIALPGTSGFVGEFLSLTGIFKANSWVAFVMATGVILGAAYSLWLYARVAFGKLVHADVAAMPDLKRREWAVMLPLAFVALWMGIYPKPFLAPLKAPVASLMARLDRADPPQTPFTPLKASALDRPAPASVPVRAAGGHS